ncbi:MAG: hypothetical protein ACLFVJ_09055, partial [Persicimonas sp.]
MKFNLKFVAISLFAMQLAALGAASCGDSAESNNDANNTNNANNGQQALDHPNAECSEIDAGTLCNITGEITEDLTLENNGTIYQLSGPVFVGDDQAETVLTVDAGVTVFADPASSSTTFLTVRRNSKIMAEGTASEPIVFTPAVDEGERQRGMWGGMIINGKAPLNTGAEAEGEGTEGEPAADEAGEADHQLPPLEGDELPDLGTLTEWTDWDEVFAKGKQLLQDVKDGTYTFDEPGLYY